MFLHLVKKKKKRFVNFNPLQLTSNCAISQMTPSPHTLIVSLKVRSVTHTAAAALRNWTHLQDFLQLAGGFDGHRGSDEGVQLLLAER